MKNRCKLIYSNDMLVATDGDTVKVFGLYIMKYYNKHYNELFSEEASAAIRDTHNCCTHHKKLSTREGIIYEAEIFRKDDTVIITFVDAPENLNPIRDNSEASPFENTVIPYIQSIYTLTGSIASSRNAKIINSIKNLTFNMAATMCKYLRTVSENKLKNADISFVYADLWRFIHEIKSEILSIKNVEIENELLSCFYTYINKENLTESILAIIKSFTFKGERAYLSCKTLDEGAMIRIANYRSDVPVNPFETSSDDSDVLTVLRITEMLIRNKIEYTRNTYSNNMREYLLYFKSERIMKVCEDN